MLIRECIVSSILHARWQICAWTNHINANIQWRVLANAVSLQAVMYVLCFRMRSLLDDPHEREGLRRLRLNDFVKHTLNPLKVITFMIIPKLSSLRHRIDSCRDSIHRYVCLQLWRNSWSKLLKHTLLMRAYQNLWIRLLWLQTQLIGWICSSLLIHTC